MSYDLIIVGGGPAGITAGIYAARKKLKTLLLTKDFLGQVAETGEVDNWPGMSMIKGMDLMKSFEKHLRKFVDDDVLSIKKGEEVISVIEKQSHTSAFHVKTASGKQFIGRAVIIATGSKPRRLKVPGEDKFRGKGVSYCALCDGPFFKDKGVVVIGGGNAGFEAALDLAKYAKRVSILEKESKVLADEILQERVKREKKITVYPDKALKKIEGNDSKVQAILYQDLATKRTFQQAADGVFIRIGSLPLTDFLKGLVELNKENEIKVNPRTGQTSLEGVFAAGDVINTPFKQIVIAAGQGCRAALAAYDYLQEAGIRK